MCTGANFILSSLALYKPFAFFPCEEACTGGISVQVEEHDNGQKNRGKGFGNKKPAPTANALHAIHVGHDDTRQGAADNARHGCGCHDNGITQAHIFLCKPLGEVVNDRREETGLGCTDEKAQKIEIASVVDESHCTGSKTPRKEDERKANSSTDSFDQDGGGHSECGIRGEEDSCANAVCSFGEVEVGVHVQCSEGQVCTIKVT